VSDDSADRTAIEGWLRAAMLGADDGIVSTAALVVGVAASNASAAAILTAGLAGLVAGAASMAAGEYVSVSSQRDLEIAALRHGRAIVDRYPEVAITEVATEIQLQGVDAGLARRVAKQLATVDPLGAYARVNLGLSERRRARPVQAALVSAASFAAGAVIPLLGMAAPAPLRLTCVVGLALVGLAICGALGAAAGGAPRSRAALRVTAGGGVAMAISHIIGRLLGIVV
jgi:VIT1/CCC1 family predicted Fe2+/Mn2+ transporter